MPWPDTTFSTGSGNKHVMEALAEILTAAANDPALTSDQKAIVARLVGLCMVRAYASGPSDAHLADQVKLAWTAMQSGDWAGVTQAINDNDLFADVI